MKHKILLKEFLENPDIQQSQNPGFKMYISDKFLSVGNKNLVRLFNDFMRNVLANNVPYLGLIDPQDPKFEEKLQKIKETYSADTGAAELKAVVENELNAIYGKVIAEQIIAGHSQTPIGFVQSIIGESLVSRDQIKIQQPTKDDWVVNIYQDKNVTQELDNNNNKEINSNPIKMKVTIHRFPIKDLDTQEIIGYLPGPVEAVFQLKEAPNDEWGFELIQVETDNDDIAEMMRGKMFEPSEIKFKRIDQRETIALQALTKSCAAYIQELSSQMESIPKNRKQDIDQEMRTLMDSLDMKIDEIKSVLEKTMPEKATAATAGQTKKLNQLQEQIVTLMTLKSEVEVKQHHDPKQYYPWLAQKFLTKDQSDWRKIFKVPNGLEGVLKADQKYSQLQSDLSDKYRAAFEIKQELENYSHDQDVRLQNVDLLITKNQKLFGDKSDTASANFLSNVKKVFSETKYQAFQNAGTTSHSIWSKLFNTPARTAPSNDNNASPGPSTKRNSQH